MPPTLRPRRLWLATSIVLASCLLRGLDGPPALAQLIAPERPTRTSPGGLWAASNVPNPTLLDRARPYLPEGLAMTAEILAGGQLEPGKGWFASGKSSTRFNWDEVASRLDFDRDGSISREEFPGPDADFRELDRNRSGRLNGDDFRFPSNAREKCRSRMIMSFADRDHDGKIGSREYGRMTYLAYRDQITRFTFFADALDEVERRYKASEKAGLPYLTLSDLRQTVDLEAMMHGHVSPPDPDSDFETATRATLLKALLNREIGALRSGPALGDPAPDFALATDDGLARVDLAGLLGRRPVVLIFGNYSSPVFRNEAGVLEKLYHRYRERAEFLLVYVREEHPVGGWVLRENTRAGISVPQPSDDRARSAQARECRKKLGLDLPMVVDTVDDRVGRLYSGLPDRLYLLDPRGSVAYKGGRAPYGFKPDELEQSLILLLSAEAAPPAGSRTPPKAP